MERILRMALALFALPVILPTNTSQKATNSGLATSSKYHVECTMCAACDNPCGQFPSPPPTPPPSSPPPAAASSNGPPPPSPPPSPPTYTYLSPPPPPYKGGTGGAYYPPPPPNPIVPSFPFYYNNPPPADVSSNSIKLRACAVSISLFSGSALLAGVLFFWCGRRRQRLAKPGLPKGLPPVTNGGTSSNLGRRFPFVAVQEATNKFDESRVIGIGGFGKVYWGQLNDGTSVAIKRGNRRSEKGHAESQFQTEIKMLSQFRHRHLVSWIGYCDEKGEMILIYEFMENGSLKNRLYGSGLPSLSWKQRLEICIGSARGLHYLHTGCAKPIIHRDVKSENILLDKNLMAKVADFGISKTLPKIDQTHVSTEVKGTFGYLDPEYFIRRRLTEKSDVYSFGVVLLEVLFARPVNDRSLPSEKQNLAAWAMKWQKRGQLDQIIDPTLVGEIRPASLRKFGETAEKCLADHGVNRPSMGNVLCDLESALQLQEVVVQGDPEENSTNNFSNAVPTGSTAQFEVSSVYDLSMSEAFPQPENIEGR